MYTVQLYACRIHKDGKFPYHRPCNVVARNDEEAFEKAKKNCQTGEYVKEAVPVGQKYQVKEITDVED